MRWGEPLVRCCARLLFQPKKIPKCDDLRAGRCFSSSPQQLLAYEEITTPRTLEAGNSREGVSPAPRTAILLHGLLGSGRNWRTWTRKLVSELEQRPASGPTSAWRFILVDLRHHGQSAELAMDPPTSIRTAAEDVLRLVHHSPWAPGGSAGSPQEQCTGAEVVIGHSVGGKVALEVARLCAAAADGATCTSVPPPQQVWVLDSVPGSLRSSEPRGQASGPSKDSGDDGDDVSKVLTMLMSIPRPVPSRRWLVQEVQRKGFSEGLAEWLGSGLKTLAKDSMDFQFDLKGALDLYSSYRSTDLFPFVESDATGGAVLQFVRAANSDRWTPETLQRLERAAAAHAKTVKLHLLPHAGHWLHVDNPQGLINVMAPVMAQVKVP